LSQLISSKFDSSKVRRKNAVKCYRASVVECLLSGRGDFVKHTLALLAIAVALLFANVTTAESMPRNGTFTGYFFTDRWGQGVFDIFFVKPELVEQLAGKSWRPIVVTSNDIQQPMNPGAAMIHQIDKVARVDDPPLKIALTVDAKSIAFGAETKLHVKVTNTSDQRVELYRRDFLLCTTVHKRGTHPDHAVARDEIYDCFNNSYGFDFRTKQILRATMNDALFTNDGAIQISGRGVPALIVDRGGKAKHADIYDEDRPTIPGNASREFTYSIGLGWFINEYELQIHYRPPVKMPVPYILSPPLSFDVTAKN
jgi:hypothetical protein